MMHSKLRYNSITVSIALIITMIHGQTCYGEWIKQMNLGLGYGPQVGKNYGVQENATVDLNYTFYRTSILSSNWEFRGGVGYSYLWTNYDQNSDVHVFTALPSIRWYFAETRNVHYYFHAAAGPSIMSDNALGLQEQGSKFIFNDYIGLGAYIGPERKWEFSWAWRHLSNALLFPPNPGFDVPFTFSVGYRFQ